MSFRYPKGGFITAFYDPLQVPDAPTIGTATAGNTQVSVAFTAPTCNGGSVISTYTVYCTTTGTNTTTGAASPLVVTGLTNSTSYTFRVFATNTYGPSHPSAASNSATPIATCSTYTTAGTYSWVAPSGVISVAAVAVGGGGGAGRNHGSGGGGGALRYVNGKSVTPGCSYTVQVGSAGSSPTACCTNPGTSGGTSSVFCISAGGGGGGAYGGGSSGSGGTGSGGTTGFSGGSGGTGVLAGGRGPGGGGGVGGYTGNGGQGANDTGSYPVSGSAGSGSSPGTGGAGGNLVCSFTSGYNGQGWASLNGASAGYLGGTTTGVGIGSGAGGGGAGGQAGRTPGAGGVRIVWCSCGARGVPSFPSTNVGA